MDNVTHTLTGLALARAGLHRLSPRAVWLLIVSANVPDLDIAAAAGGAFRYLEVHRGYTHSLLGLPLMAALSTAVVAAVFRQRLPWLRAWLLCLIGVASHLLLDWTTSYGIRLLLPFSSRWFSLDLNALYDAYILLILSFAALWPWFSRLVNREIGERRAASGRGVAIAALSLFLLFDVGRAELHNRVVAELESRLYNDAPPLQTAALPDAYNPLRWRAVVETANDFRTRVVNPLAALSFGTPAIFYKSAVTPALQNASKTDPFRYFLYFARFPVWSIQPVFGENTRATRLDLTDLRFGTPAAGDFHCVGLVDARGVLLHKWFTFGSGGNVGWDRP